MMIMKSAIITNLTTVQEEFSSICVKGTIIHHSWKFPLLIPYSVCDKTFIALVYVNKFSAKWTNCTPPPIMYVRSPGTTPHIIRATARTDCSRKTWDEQLDIVTSRKSQNLSWWKDPKKCVYPFIFRIYNFTTNDYIHQQWHTCTSIKVKC